MIVIVLPDIAAEDRLLAHARRGDQDAMMRIYENYFPPIFNFIRLRVDDLAVAEDLASNVFLKLIDAMRGRNAPHHSLRGWLFRVARNELHDHYGRNQYMTTETLDEWIPASGDEEPEIQFIRTMNIERARRALRMLAPDQQEVLVLRFAQSLSLDETASIMGKSISAVKSLQFRAINTLRHILGELHVEADNG